MLRGSGVPGYLFQIVSLAGLLFFSLKTKRFFWFLIFPLCSILSLYFPIGLHYGMPEYGHIASLLATDITESADFVESIPLWQWFVPFLLISGLVFVKYLGSHIEQRIFRKETFLFYIFVFLISLLSIFGWESARYDITEFLRLTPWWKYSLFFVFFAHITTLVEQRLAALPVIELKGAILATAYQVDGAGYAQFLVKDAPLGAEWGEFHFLDKFQEVLNLLVDA